MMSEWSPISLWRAVYAWPRVIWIIANGKMLLSPRMSTILFPREIYPHNSVLSDHTSPAHSHRSLRIPLTNSTPRQTDKCLHYAGQPPTLSADISKEVFKWQTAVICCDVTWHDDIPEWQTQQWCASWDSVNWKWEIKSRFSHWIPSCQVLQELCVSKCVMA